MDGPDQPPPYPSDTAHASKVASLWQLIPHCWFQYSQPTAAQGRPLETPRSVGRLVGWF